MVTNVLQDSGSLLIRSPIFISSEISFPAVVASSRYVSQVSKKVRTSSSSCKTHMWNMVARVWILVVPSCGSNICFSLDHISAAVVSFQMASACLSSTCNHISSFALLSLFFQSFHDFYCVFFGAWQVPKVISSSSSRSRSSSILGFQIL